MCDCMVVPVIRFQTTLVRFLVYGSCCDMLHSEVALVAKHWWVDLIEILGCLQYEMLTAAPH